MTDVDVVGGLAALHSSTAALVKELGDGRWSDGDARAASVLPGWTRGHVLTHLARNADALGRTITGALRGESVARYPDGPVGRAADIEAGAGRPFVELVDDVSDSAAGLDRVFAVVAADNGWDLVTEDGTTVADWLFRRWREVEIHRVDLGGPYTPDRWPAAFVAYLLPEIAPEAAGRCAESIRIQVAAAGSVCGQLANRAWGDGPVLVSGADWQLLAWLIGRPQLVPELGAPELSAWS